MPLNKSQLSSDILTVFKSMKDNYKTQDYDGDDEFAKGIAKAFKDFGEGGEIITVDTGAVSAGAFTGTGSGSLSLSDSASYSTLKSAVKEMKTNNKDDDYLAGEFKKALQDMYDASDIVETSVNGSIVIPAGGTTTVTGASGKGTIKCNFSTVETGLKSFFALMKNIDNNKTDSDLANEITNLVYTAVVSGVISTQDEGEISGAVGVGTIS